MENNNINLLKAPLATAWNKSEGQYSEDLAKKILNFETRQKLKFRNVLDICCGSGNLLNIMSENGKKCYGTEVLEDFIIYNQTQNSNINILNSNSILDFDNIRTFDLITCTNKVINNLSDVSLWRELFDKVYKNLNNGGVFIFDFYTQKRLSNWNETTHNEYEDYDHIKVIKSAENKTTITDTYYLKSPDDDKKLKKVELSETKYAIKNEMILNEIKASKYRYLIPVDINLKPIHSLNDLDVGYIIAIKREGV